MKNKFLLLVSLLLVLLCSVEAHQQNNQNQDSSSPFGHNGPPVYNIRGRIYLPDGSGAETYIRLTLRRSTQEIVWQGYTDSNGNFEVKNLADNLNNSYELVAWGDEHFETTVQRVDLTGGISRTEVVNIHLRPKEKPSQPAPGVVSVLELDRAIPKSARREYERGTKAAAKKEPEKAIQHFQRAIEIHDLFPQAHNDLGVQYLRLNRLVEARAAFVKAMNVAPKMTQPYLNLGRIQIQEQQYEEAVTTLTRAVELDGTDWRGHAWLGVGLMETKQETQAEQELRKALELSAPPEGSFIHLYLANLYIRRGELAQAIAHGEAYLQEAPQAADAAAVRAKIEHMRDQIQ